jgi:hypothetical protein
VSPQLLDSIVAYSRPSRVFSCDSIVQTRALISLLSGSLSQKSQEVADA